MGAVREQVPALQPQTTPAAIFQATFSFAVTRMVVAGLELDLFTLIQRGHTSVEALAAATSASERGLRILLNALVAHGFLEKQPGQYRLTDVSAKYLSKDGSRYLGGVVLHTNLTQENWAHLTDIVRTGRPWRAVEGAEDEGEFFSHLVDSLYNLNADAADVAAQVVGTAGPVDGVLDIGAGSGVWSLAFGRRFPQARLTMGDWPQVIEAVTRRIVEREGLSERVSYLPGNFRESDFGEARFDVVTIGHVCHSEGSEHTRELFRRVHRALRPGGRVVIAEFLVDEGRREAAVPLLFALNMLVSTEEGDTFSFSELRQWLEEAGFRHVRPLEAPAPSPLVIAVK